MPECSVKCPKVRRYLREIVAETPWILDEQKPASDDEEIASYTVATTWSRPKGKHIEDSPYPSTSTEDAEAGASTKFSEKSDKVKKTIHEDITTGFEETMETRKKQDIDHEQLEKSKLIATTDESGSSTGDQRDRRKDKQHIVPRDIDAGKSDVMSVKLNGRSRKEREIISDKMKARSSHSSSSLEISTRLADGETSTHKKEAGHDQMLQTADDARKSTEFTQTGSRMTCSSICSRNISKEQKIKKYGQRQRDADNHLSSNGFNYFDDVCTCCLSCLVQQLTNDPFVQSIFASVALFAVGIKLSIELDAWNIPMRIL